MVRRLFMCVSVVGLLLFLGACGRGDGNESNENGALYESGFAPGGFRYVLESGEDAEFEITMLVPRMFETVISGARRRLERELPENVSVSITPTFFEGWEGRDVRDARHARLQTMLMAGQSYDLIIWDGFNYRAWAENGFLTDIYTLIDSHPTQTRDDFFVNVLEAFEHRGGLYLFPLSFGFQYVGVNASLPESILSRFENKESVTAMEIVRTFGDLQRDYFDDFNEFSISTSAMGHTIAPTPFLTHITSQFVDFDNRVSHLNSDAYLEHIQAFVSALDFRAFRTIYVLGAHDNNLVFRRGAHEIAHSNTAFLCLSTSLDPVAALFDTVEDSSFFTNILPLADEEGRLIIDPLIETKASSLGSVAIPAAGNAEIAWEFTQMLLKEALSFDWPVVFAQFQEIPMSRQFFGVGTLTVPITKADFRPHITRVLEFHFTNYTRRPGHGPYLEFMGIHDESITREEAMESAILKLWNLSHMPIAVFEHTLPDVFYHDDLIDNLFRRVIRPEAFVQEAHNRIGLWLMEQR